MPPDARFMSIGEVAKFFDVSVEAVRDWADKGKIRSFRTPGGTRRFWRAEVESLIPPGPDADPDPEPEAELAG